MYNIEMLSKAMNEAIKFYDDYSSIASAAKNKPTKDKAKNEAKKEAKQDDTEQKAIVIKILTPKQML